MQITFLHHLLDADFFDQYTLLKSMICLLRLRFKEKFKIPKGLNMVRVWILHKVLVFTTWCLVGVKKWVSPHFPLMGKMPLYSQSFHTLVVLSNKRQVVSILKHSTSHFPLPYFVLNQAHPKSMVKRDGTKKWGERIFDLIQKVIKYYIEKNYMLSKKDEVSTSN